MTEIKQKTFEEHLQFLYESTKVMLYFSWGWKKKHPEKDIKDIIQKGTIISSLSCQEEGPKQDCLIENLTKIHTETEDSVAAVFEKKAFALIKPELDRTAPQSYEKDINRETLKKYNAGSLKYDPPLECLPSNHCNFHIANAIAPQSIFDDKTYLPKCFTQLMDKSEKEYGYDTIRTFTWLNSLPKWLELFPEEWQENMSTPYEEPVNNLGTWGQIINARGTFNAKAGEFIRQNFDLKYKAKSSHCSFENLRKHLKKFL